MRRSILAISMLLACAPAAGAQGRDALLLRDEPARPDRRCTVLARLTPRQTATLDPAALGRAIAADATLPREGTVLYSVRLDERGAISWVRPIETTLPETAELRVQAAVRARLRASAAEEPWAFRVRVTLGEAPEVRIGRSEVCQAQLRERPVVDDVQLASLTREERAEVRRLDPARLSALVGTDGRVRDVRVLRPSRSRAQDRVAVSEARESVWFPLLVDGFPAEAWVGFYLNTANRR